MEQGQTAKDQELVGGRGNVTQKILPITIVHGDEEKGAEDAAKTIKIYL